MHSEPQLIFNTRAVGIKLPICLPATESFALNTIRPQKGRIIQFFLGLLAVAALVRNLAFSVNDSGEKAECRPGKSFDCAGSAERWLTSEGIALSPARRRIGTLIHGANMSLPLAGRQSWRLRVGRRFTLGLGLSTLSRTRAARVTSPGLLAITTR